ncbi:MAG: cysteine desulfurase [Candidatus Yanofskybacteria bacterium]|nr:cysteine desulfurase [Candidatus Yanofskybacteria bacterium]
MVKPKGNRKFYYLDNAAAAPIDSRVRKEVERGMKIFGNPSSFNNAGRQASKELAVARLKVARFLGTHPEEVIFTASGSEANNLAIQGIARNFQFSIFKIKSKFQNLKPHIITTKIEHPSVLESIKQLEKEGFEVTYLLVDKEGFVNPDKLKNSLRPETVLVSVMYANNEIGTIEPINKIGKIIKEFKTKNEKLKTANYPLFHVDACQAAGYLNMNVNNLQADLVTFNGSKIGGPRGIGVLYVRQGVALTPQILGGGQEGGLRAGTENLPSILGLAKAVELIDNKESVRVASLRDYFIDKLQTILPEIKVNGPVGETRLPNNINMSIPGLDSENLLLELDKYGIQAGSGSACMARSVEPSHVLKAIGTEKRYLSGVLRFSLGRKTSKKDLDYVLKILPKAVKDLKKRYRK